MIFIKNLEHIRVSGGTMEKCGSPAWSRTLADRNSYILSPIFHNIKDYVLEF